jgi:hypothetical protein
MNVLWYESELGIELQKSITTLEKEMKNSKDEIVQLEISLSDSRAAQLKTQDDYDCVVREMREVFLCLQQYYVECEVLKKGVLQLGGEDILQKLEDSSKEATNKLLSTAIK